ncbi:hypothetical protein C8Q79DRAFT_926350 [Trametes meyenii]|nr:hypothetical protein C8Q79DRAFT_926350 [Trametes meyenii]
MVLFKSTSNNTRSSLTEIRFSLKIRKPSSKSTRTATDGISGIPSVCCIPPHEDTNDSGRASVVGISAAATPPLFTSSLLPLSLAQSRKDIRERKEGFEMSQDTIPFAIRTQTLLPLNVAFAREDIRRRHEGYEAPADASDASPHRPIAALETSDVLALVSTRLSVSVSQPSFHSRGSTLSVYSHNTRSWNDLSGLEHSSDIHALGSFDSLVAAYANKTGDSQNDEAGLGRVLASGSTSSFDEESFMRMAEACVDW